MTHYRECEGCGIRLPCGYHETVADAKKTLRIYRWWCDPEVVLSRILCEDCSERVHDAITQALEKHAPRWQKKEFGT